MNRPGKLPSRDQPSAQAGAKGKIRGRLVSETTSLYLAVSAGAIIGSVLRALASMAALAWLGPAFPWGTLFVNVVGSFIIGFYATLTEPGGRLFASAHQRQFVMTGICGGFTTFSAFSLETLRLAQGGAWLECGLYVFVSAATWLVAVWLGYMLAARLNRLGGV